MTTHDADALGVTKTPELTTCPHCGGETALTADPRARWVCAACGGPRVPVRSGDPRALVRARAAQVAAFAWSAGTIALATSGAMAAGLAALLASVSSAAAVIVGALAFVMLASGWRASRKARARRSEVKNEVDAAWRDAVVALLAARGGDTSAADVAREMRIEESDADALLGDLGAHERVRVEIGDEGRVRYRVDAPEASDGATRRAERARDGDDAEGAPDADDATAEPRKGRA